MSMKAFNPSKDIPQLNGKVFFITGGTAGLGASTISVLATKQPDHIYFSGRDAQKADKLIQKVRASKPDAKISFIKCDLSSLASVQEAAREFTSASDRLDVLMCNAGIMAVPDSTTKDGYEVQFGTNHMGHALLIKLLMPTLLRTAGQQDGDARVVNLSSIAYKQAPGSGIEFSTLKTSQKKLGGIIPGPTWSRYGQSKLANMLYVQELARNYPTVTSVAVHPGVIYSGLWDGMSMATKIPAMLSNLGKSVPVEEGCYNQLWAATCSKSDLVSGEYYVPVAKKGSRQTKPSKSTELPKQLWDWTEKELAAYEKL